MYYILPLVVILLLILVLIARGKPQDLKLRIKEYLDSFETIDYSSFGKLLTPYKAWKNTHPVDELLVQGAIRYRSAGFFRNWNTPAVITLTNVVVPAGFELYLRRINKEVKEFSQGIPMTIHKGKDNAVNFLIGLRQNDTYRSLPEPEKVSFVLDAVVKGSFLFFKTDIHKTIPHQFHIGPEMGGVWMGFDPGTSGSCVAVASSGGNIALGKDRANETIIPSVLSFNKTVDYHANGNLVPENTYIYGSPAFSRLQETQYVVFQSLKKLLGFRDIKEIRFQNNSRLELDGRALASTLVKGVFNDVIQYFRSPAFNTDDYKDEGKFDPQRAVVAIPNNFTATKIEAIIGCIENIGQFKEIRYVYEAEAVLFYYLSNYNRLNKGKRVFDSEVVLLFDMGGATINATVVRTTIKEQDGRKRYDIDILAKIGYGIGGDTIDFCISQLILGAVDEFPTLKGIGLQQYRQKLITMAFEIKKEIIYNYYQGNDYLLTAQSLAWNINKNLGLTLTIDEDSSELYSHFKKLNGQFKLFTHPLFDELIYSNVIDAANEVIDLANDKVDKIIFSGRSTAFPLIKESVERLFGKKPTAETIPLEFDELKTAVVKGACWYGVNKGAVRLGQAKASACFGFKKTLSADTTDVCFYELVEMGDPFNRVENEVRSYTGKEPINDDFAFDNSRVNFLQVMGKDAEKILSEDQKHKFSRIASISLPKTASEVAIKVNENDEVECIVRLETGQFLHARGMVPDQEIDEANEEHYTWVVK